MYKLGYALMEKNKLPDFVIRHFIRKLCAERIRSEERLHFEKGMSAYVEDLKNSPIAVHTQEANEQHYELPPKFFELCLGENLKYSSCYYPRGTESLSEAEAAMLELYCQRAEISDNMDILDLGCGWGSFSLYAAKKFPTSRFTLVSNSRPQKEFIMERAQKLGVSNIKIITADINELELELKFNRIVSIEMFEHMRNYKLLFQKVSRWLKPDGKLFAHIFCHKNLAYKFEPVDETDWMARYFFTGGQMPSYNLLSKFDEDLEVKRSWEVSGSHYQKTSEHWLQNLDKNKDKIMPILESTYGQKEALKWFVYWRVFFMACAELFGYNKGQEWLVGHYLFERS